MGVRRGSRFALAALAVVAVAGALSISAPIPASADVLPVNPVRVPLNGHPANSGFLVFVEGDVFLSADEAEGTLALGGDLGFATTYNVGAGPAPAPTFTAPGDSAPTFLYVGGGISFPAGASGPILRVLNGGFTKVADTSTYTAFNRDSNNAAVNYRLVRPGQTYESSPSVEGTTPNQSPASIGTPVPASLIDIPGAFSLYRTISSDLGGCVSNATLTDDQGAPLVAPYPPGSRGRLSLTPGVTNVLEMTAADLDALAEITFLNAPTASTPLVVNVTGSTFTGTTPNLPGISSGAAPYILWNFPDATAITVTGGDSIEGTIYAPNAALTWAVTQNIEGNVIAASFTHGPPPVLAQPREIHSFPFATEVSCSSAPTEPTGTLTLEKIVVNVDGTAEPQDWTLTATGPTTITGPGNSAAVTGQVVPAGNYTLDETGGPPGYEASAWNCEGGTVAGNVVTVPDETSVVCTITNTEIVEPLAAGTLTLEKVVVNDDGDAVPGDWTLTATGPATVTGAGNSPDVTNQSVPAGDYTLSESDGPAGYEAGPWECEGGAVAGDVVTVADEASVVCTITNTEIPLIPPPEPEPGPDDSGGVAGDGESLPNTGTDAFPAGAAGLALLFSGVALLAGSRRIGARGVRSSLR